MTKEDKGFLWACQPKAEQFISKTLAASLEKSQFLRDLEQKLYHETSTRLMDWVDHVEVGYSDELARELDESGFISEIATPLYRVFFHPGAKLPLVVVTLDLAVEDAKAMQDLDSESLLIGGEHSQKVKAPPIERDSGARGCVDLASSTAGSRVRDQSHPFVAIALSVESIADFLMCRGMSCWIEGSPYSQFRRACISKEQGVFVYVVERRGVLSMEPIALREGELDKIFGAYEKWQTRPRCQDKDVDEDEGIIQAIGIAEEIVESVGQGMAAWIVLDVERRFWQTKNQAAQIQKNRQDHLGMGWANHDHHTFRSSRRNFRQLVRLFEILGFHARERFYAGSEAGWGAQVMEQKEARLVLFLDVDLSPHEIEGDFAHGLLEERTELGTIGLWCALHGESILKAGMHHLEAQFDFDKLSQDLLHKGIGVMAPFTNLPYLRQAFTQGERWKVVPARLERLLAKGLISQEQAERFSEQGAIGSHLENLERKEGFKGFNQRSVSDIIQRTDPRGA